MTRKEYAIYVITKHGLQHAIRLKKKFPEADLYVSPRFIKEAPEGSKLLSLPMEPTLRETFTQYDCHVHIISVGAVVRMVAPLLVNKKVDPAVVCVDDQANFSVALLSGHVGRGNFYTQEVADALGSTAVITTASDVSGTLTVDILGRELGWKLEDMDRNVTRGCAAVVNELKTLFVQECGEPHWWPLHKPLPKGVEYTTTLEGVNPAEYEMLLITSFRIDIPKTHPAHYDNSVIYHPKVLVLGIGCDKGTTLETLEEGLLTVLERENLSLKSVKAIASVDAKKEEAGLIALVKKYGWEFKTYPAEVLDQVQGIENPSEMPKLHVGTRSVSEAASLILSEAEKLLVPKQKYKSFEKNMTIAVSVISHPPRPSRNLEVKA